MKLSKWKCGNCGFEWFEQLHAPDTVSSIDHGCPQGCDDAGGITGKVEATDKDGEWIVRTLSKAQVCRK